MDPTRLMTQTAVITHVALDNSTDDYGNPELTSSEATVPCWLHQTQRDERTVESDTQEQTWTVYFPPGTVVDGSDRFTVDGEAFELAGPPWPAFNPRLHRVTHIEATARRVA